MSPFYTNLQPNGQSWIGSSSGSLAADGSGEDFRGVEISLEIVSIIELWRFPSGCATHLSEVGATRRMVPRGLIFSPIARNVIERIEKVAPPVLLGVEMQITS